MFVLLTLTACSNKELVYVDRPIYVKIPTKCDLTFINCDFNRESDSEVISSLIECIIDLKRVCGGE